MSDFGDEARQAARLARAALIAAAVALALAILGLFLPMPPAG